MSEITLGIIGGGQLGSMLAIATKKLVQAKKKLPTSVDDESPSVDKIKASDGKTYKFLGSQWAQLLPSVCCNC